METPELLASRLIKSIESIGTFNPLFAQWYTVSYDEVFQPIELYGGSLAKCISLRVRKDDDGKPNPSAGYPITIYNFGQPKWTPRGFSISMRAGSDKIWSGNAASFATSNMCDPDLAVVSFNLFRRALLARVPRR